MAGGELVTKIAREKNLPILPVDSEHSAIFQCMQFPSTLWALRHPKVEGCPSRAGWSLRSNRPQRIILTASGGAFFGKTRAELEHATVKDALQHPVWDMGAKITVDSATMFNKGLEVIEAAWLFDLDVSKIDVLIHRQSIVHSLVEYCDGAVLAQLGLPSMCLPIQYALTYPNREASPSPRLDLAKLGTLTFEAPRHEDFPAINLCKMAWELGGTAPAALNGANEAANELFRAGKLRFLDIAHFVEQAMHTVPNSAADNLDNIFAADQAARQKVVCLSQP